MKYTICIQISDINTDFVVKVNDFLEYKLKMLKDFIFNLAVMIKLIDYFDDFMLNIMAGLGQKFLQFVDK